MSIATLLDSEVTSLVLGFIFTSVLGAYIGRALQDRSWQRQTRVDLFRKRYEEGMQLLAELSTLIGERSFALQKLLWAAEGSDPAVLARAKARYEKAVFRWNVNRWRNRSRIWLLMGEEQANLFLDFADNPHPETPRSIHYTFVKTHRYVSGAMAGKISVDAAERELLSLSQRCSEFMEILTMDFAGKASTLELLQVPEVPRTRPLSFQSAASLGQIVDTSAMKLRGHPHARRVRPQKRMPRPVADAPAPAEGSG